MTGDDQSLRVAETFSSNQGEGKRTGTPSFFIRLSGCNLRCIWCDTPYASWNPEGPTRSINDLITEARSANLQHVVITGGEPMIFPLLAPLTQQLKQLDHHITLETAGTVFRPPAELACDLMSISPKLANSTPAKDDPRDPTAAWHDRHEQRRLNLHALQQLIDHYPDHQLKFVTTSDQDLAEIEPITNSFHNLHPRDILLMPERDTPHNQRAQHTKQHFHTND